MSAYFRPDTIEDALALASDGAVAAAGCTDLFPATEAPALAGRILDLTGVEALRGISETEQGWRIGAMTCWADIAAADLPPGFDGLRQAAREVGSVQIQNAATIGGNLCNASPAADGVPPLLTLDAEAEIVSVRGNRRLSLADFLLGPRRTALQDGELLSAVHVPRGAAQGRAGFLKLGARRYLVISIASVAVRVDAREGKIADLAIAVGACGPVPTRLARLETALTGEDLGALARGGEDGMVQEALSPISDVRGDAAYRLDVAATLVRRALRDVARIGGEA